MDTLIDLQKALTNTLCATRQLYRRVPACLRMRVAGVWGMLDRDCVAAWHGLAARFPEEFWLQRFVEALTQCRQLQDLIQSIHIGNTQPAIELAGREEERHFVSHINGKETST